MQTARTVARPNDDACQDGALQATSNDRKARQRHNEKIGGGYFIFRRGTRTGRVKTGHIMHGKMPFEHPSHDSALTEAQRLAGLYGGKYDVFARVDVIDGGPVKRFVPAAATASTTTVESR